MAKQKDFSSFLSNIEPSKTTVDYISSVQINLRDYLQTHESYKNIHVQTFLSGSYAKHTCIRPVLNDGKRDVDIVVETNYGLDADSRKVLKELRDVLKEKSIYSNARLQSHSVGIEMSGIEIDIVPLIKDKSGERYCIGSSDKNCWNITDPKGHISWSSDVNTDNDKMYKPLVKMIKWWRRKHCPDDKKYPKGIALEKIIADNLADSELNTENHLIGTMQNIVAAYTEDYVDQGIIPVIADPTIDDNNLLSSYSVADFKAFIKKLTDHLQLLSENGATNDTWREIMGTEFPKQETKGLVECSALAIKTTQTLSVPHRLRPSWGVPRGCAVVINARVQMPDGSISIIENDGPSLPKGCSIDYRAICGVKAPYYIKWQVVNTGKEAANANCLRGGFEDSNAGMNTRHETTAYTGKHFVQCFVIKKGMCAAKSKEFIINVE